jgi:Lon protease-like protein
MAPGLQELPLFPLETVLFPFAQVQLHIFEERYRQMIDRCLEEELAFGIVLIRSGSEVGGTAEPYLVGTSARIVGLHRFENGTIDLKIIGAERFRVRELDESQPYLVGRVEPLREEPTENAPRRTALVQRARECMSEYITGALTSADYRVADIRLPDDPYQLSFLLASLLQMPNLEKQALLELTDTNERLSASLPVIQRQIDSLEIIDPEAPAGPGEEIESLLEEISPN